MSGGFLGQPGTKRFTADGQAGTGTRPCRVYGVYGISGSGGAGIIVLRNGNSPASSAYIQMDASAASKGFSLSDSQGVLFPSGCYVDIDTNVDSVVVSFAEEL